MSKRSVIAEPPDSLGGIPVFQGTRVPGRTMFDYFIQAHSLMEFPDDFPTVSPEQAASALEDCRKQLLKTHRQRTALPEREARSSADVHSVVARAAAPGPTPSLEPNADSREAIYGDRA